ncbi:50S ribosomal protein L11 methyltransferase [Zunongwangia profunda]|uniref:Ribosomal protein L11 methyltransferase n=2 Tax=Zunongwangia profunda TaxID=398743 RepID=D5BHU1_ZUNPS|nr:50S ribosomal protein L11 methyltransferase [Zunongwangia profunda]ADF51329.1 ribosomal protein L11 methyltransferase [Zunongwangia profunda SM-A87]HAJ82317.1 50S ribosomal protein L11 methyltransferase [Zunongwangia profunda]HCV82240.1 50S ribosomal protein L11 methyltransferase [Zunongwangia profunda]|tara:strand:- start:3135 stop:3968 length:834 start_codon:yes stop_codon:yes gene_type:complete
MASNYLEFQFKIHPPVPASEILIAELGSLGFESFVENEDGVTAYILKEEFNENMLTEVRILDSDEFKISYSSSEIQQVNWNEEWEKNFQPIVVDDICSVRAPFHPKPETEFDIVIEPKMSFGTGHHATTHMMIQFILKNEWKGKSVLDMGCGTGVLAILSSQKGANPVEAIDIDNWCYLNSLENIERNNVPEISVKEGGAELLGEKKYDVIIANINRNILLNDMQKYVSVLQPDGDLYLSGFYKEDIPIIQEACEKLGLKFQENLEKDKWVAVKFSL